ncbi:MAG: FixH family protein [Capnocytophaga sp.]|nr:FixH family protein [Capnocytophaga sp.]
MKINWGWGIVIAIVSFIGFIMYFVIQMSVNKAYDHEFVTDEYYKKELRFQNDLVKENKTREAKMNVTAEVTADGLELRFPQNSVTEKVQGFVFFYRPSDITKDFQLPINATDGKMVITKDKLAGGRWNVQVNYVINGQEYLSSEKITIQ